MESTSGINNRASGLPRPSRLPQLQSRSSQIFGSTAQDVNATTGSSPSKTSAVQKRSTTATVARPRPQSNNIYTAPPGSFSKSTTVRGSSHASTSSVFSRSTNIRSSSQGPKISTNSGNIAVRPSSRATSTTSVSSTAKSVTSSQLEENHDILGSLDPFRSASRGELHVDTPQDMYLEAVVPNVSKDRKASRPSLSDRTIESLQSVPSTPKDRRRSSFFSPVESPMGPPPRPISRSSRTGSNPNSRPSTSDGNFILPSGRPSSPAKPAPVPALPPSRTSTARSSYTTGGSVGRVSGGNLASKLQSRTQQDISAPRTPSTASKSSATKTTNSLRTAKPVKGTTPSATRPAKPRAALVDAFGPTVRSGSPAAPQSQQPRESPPTARKISDRTVSNPSSSAALRQQIAAARAAARKEKTKHDSPQNGSSFAGNGIDVEVHTDPFNQAPRDEKHILRNRINTARRDGRLNIAALNLKEIPEDVLQMYDSASMAASNQTWAEVVDLHRLNAADNDFEVLSDDVFPDKTAEQFEAAEQNHQFGGLEAIDFHGNSLCSLPIGLRRLERLTSLNLAHNKLGLSGLDVISQLTTLKDLNLGHNLLTGSLPASICQLGNLEFLNLQSNRLVSLPEAIRELVNLKILNVSGNQLTSLPMEAIQEVNLTELDASANVLVGSLFPHAATSEHPTLHTLRIANNSLAALSFTETVDLPRLRELDVTNNQMTHLPPVSGWVELVTLTAGDNKIDQLPTGFSDLHKLKTANFASNNLRLLDPQICTMEGLEHLILSANPLREKKFLTMSAYDIKRDLAARIAPPEQAPGGHSGTGSAESNAEISASSPRSSWSLKSNGTLDLANQNLSDDVNDGLGSFLQSHDVKGLYLQTNKFTAIPPALWLGYELRILDLSGNKLGSDYLSDELTLPALQELSLPRCGITTLEPLLTQLRAPKLQTLNVTANRLSGALPHLRSVYTTLTTLLAGDNQFDSITAETLRGFHTVSLASNNIQRLPAEVGLLWDEGLHSLQIGSNAFRVPNYRVLDKGTEATLRWLRDRLPASTNVPAEED